METDYSIHSCSRLKVIAATDGQTKIPYGFFFGTGTLSYSLLTFAQSTTVQKRFMYSSLPHTPYPALTHAC